MELHLNIPEWLKIPIKILLPTVCLLCGFLVYAPDHMLIKLNVYEWKMEHGTVLGLCFLACTCLIIIYFLYFLLSGIYCLWMKLTSVYRTLWKIKNLNDMERAILLEIYRSANYTMKLNYSDPMISGLLKRGYIYSAETQVVTLGWNNSMNIPCTLQPNVSRAYDYVRDKTNQQIKKLEKRIINSEGKKKEKLEKKLDEYTDIRRKLM